MTPGQLLLGLLLGVIVFGGTGYGAGFWLGLRKGHAEAISVYRKRMTRSQTDVDRFAHMLGLDDPRPVLRSAVIKPTASRRSQVGVDEDSR